MTKDEINYIWEIRELKTQSINGIDNVVDSINYFILADYVDGNYSSDILPTRVVLSEQHTIEVPFTEGETFIKYEDLTEETVKSWLFNLIDKEEIEQRLFIDLQQQYAKKTSLVNKDTAKPLPW